MGILRHADQDLPVPSSPKVPPYGRWKHHYLGISGKKRRPVLKYVYINNTDRQLLIRSPCVDTCVHR